MPNPFPPELRWLLPKVRAQIPRHIGSFSCLTAASLLALVTPLSVRWLIDFILPARNSRLLVAAVGLIFVSYEGKAILSVLGGYLTFRAAQESGLDLRLSLLRHLDSLSAEYFDRTPVGEMLYAFGGPIDDVCFFGSDLLPSILRTLVGAAVTLSAMAVLSPVLTLVVIPLIPPFLVLRHRYRKRIGREADMVQTARSKFSGFLQEHLSALTQIQLLRQVEAQEESAHRLLADVVRSQDALCRTGSVFSAVSNLVICTGIALVLGCGSALAFRARLTIGTLVAFYSLLVQLFDPLSAAMEMYARTQRTFASIRQMRAVFEIRPHVREHCHARPLSSTLPLGVSLMNVSFGYGGRSPVLHIPRLEIRQGERIAIVGQNGAGKSTLGKLLARLYDVEAGEISIGGCDVRTVALQSLRASVCYLPAQPILFHRSVSANLCIGGLETAEDDMVSALAMAGLNRHLDGGSLLLDECITPGGTNLSNGERQRLAIARALLHKPKILIFDETTSSLDPNSEESILRSVGQMLRDSTLIVVTHRLHSVSWMERILVMDNGQVVGDGNHSVLAATNPHYIQLLKSATSVR
jgi:ABC-type multidrug transport system fused ATPase/permease subunit